MDLTDLWRILNAVLAIVCAVGYARTRIWHQRHRRTAEETLLRLGVLILLFAVAWGSAEAMVRGNTFVWAQALATCAYLCIGVGLWSTRPIKENP